MVLETESDDNRCGFVRDDSCGFSDVTGTIDVVLVTSQGQ